MVIETFRGGDLGRCFQLMECDDRSLLDEWTARWADLADIEVTPVVTSAEARAAAAPRP
jgi:hypothetical protein